MQPRRDPVVLILYARYGAGHIQVAEALQQAFEKNGAARVVLLDLFRESHPWVDAASKFLYRKSFTLFPTLYGWTYYRTKDMSHDRLMSRHFNSFGLPTLKKSIEAVQPDLVINTFPMLAMPEFRRQTGQRIPTFAVLTDFVLHNRWIHPEIDKYYVATDDLAEQLFQKGVLPHQVVVSGIPIRQGFQRAQDLLEEKHELARRYQLTPQKRKVLLSAGGYGVSWNWLEIIQSFAEQDWEVLVACGNNEAMRSDLLLKTAPLADVHIFGYLPHIEELMKTADLLVTKAGGITLAEALSLQLPILILSPVPGQELENARYLEAKGAARVVRTREDLAEIKHLLQKDELLSSLVQTNHTPLGQQNSAERVVADMKTSWKEGMTSRVLHQALPAHP
ncbi:UDP-N-acetylglucosamine 2-epimerase [Tumebacillus sp. ITR2]|uniref:UDP-N-acetylglucosamine 2-epimerase n=1 Tax=Tumebacillus amylolyticus TaxID=2801339 RepID=A0ABS1JFB0_9BACL|nr:glycosyltransferase [Tumebacillus amylolyticus]MBL0388982.1 UDP-N-acetylglucosamine 2-epimerase [Tumebacillus amylolyticus]